MNRMARLLLVVVMVLAAGAGGWWLVHTFLGQPTRPGETAPIPDGGTPAAGGNGKLVVLVVFDQFRGDYLERWASSFGPDGFERMKRDGAWFANCHIPYACTSTAPGHASIATGAPPSVHGIIENAWLERKDGGKGNASLMYCVQASREFALVPALPRSSSKPERGSELGYSPENLLAPTVSDALRASTAGKSRVVSLSIKDRAAVLMGGRNASTAVPPPAVYCFDLRDGKFHTDAYYAGQPQPWVQRFNDQRSTFDQWVGKKWDRLRDLDYNQLAGPDDAAGESYGYNQGRIFPHPMNEKAPNGGPEYYRALENSPFGNEVLLEFAKAAVVGENLGGNGATDLLCVSFSSNDLVGHQWGPDSWEVLDVTLRSDLIMRDMMKFLDTRLGKDRYTLVLTADHGICRIPEQKKIPTADRKNPFTVLTELAAALDATFGRADTPEQWFAAFEYAEDVWPWVYLNRGSLAKRGIPYEAVCDYAAQWLGNRDYMMMGFTRKQIETGTLPTLPPDQEQYARDFLAQLKLAYRADRCGDLIAVPKPGVLLTKYPGGTAHGTPHPYDTHVAMLAYGAGVPALGRRDERVSSLIAAPTVAWALGIKPPENATEPLPPALLKR